MRIGEVLDRVYDEEVGWRPVTGTIKPVHIANGMFRALTGRQHDISRIIAFIVWWRKKNEKLRHEQRTFARLVTDQPEGPFACFRTDERRFDQARDFARAILGTDSAVFPDADHSSLTLTCAQMISPDEFDRGLGAFAAALVGGASGDAPLAAAVRSALDVDQPDDPVSTLVWPLLDHRGRSVTVAAPPAMDSLAARAPDYIAQLQAAAACLATHEANQGNRLRTLQRAVHFACVSTQSHVQALVAEGVLADRIPALLAVRSPTGSALTTASETTLTLLHDRFEDWLRDRLAARIAAGQPLHRGETIDLAVLRPSAAVERLDEVLRDIGPYGRGQGQLTDEVLKHRFEDLEEALRLHPEPTERAAALAHAIWAAYRREYGSGGPRQYLLRIGRWSGLIYPHFQGPGQKRVRPTVALLDMLVRSCVPCGESVPLEDFLERLWLRFGLIAGGRGDGQHDAALLRRHGVDLDANRLVENTEDLVDQLAALGLARRYADNVTFVGDGHAA
ncbi:hypothetical protein [Methylobacterium sp. sgz302541]|uniref:hypothetical protein n=1 Tax=unclassified Methylobacterium TaxID=2615210 RepID=UPI003D3301D6